VRGTLLLALLAVLVAVAAGCAGDDERAVPPTITTAPPTTTAPPPETTTEPEVETVALVPTPDDALRRCRRSPTVAPACPRQVPEAPYDPASPIYAAEAHPGAETGTRVFSLQWGAEHPGQPELDRPPATVHVVVSAGARARGPASRPAALRDGLLEERRRTYLALGRATWGGRRGDVLLAPPFPRGGLEANHLVFRWAEGDVATQVSLHGWEPFTEVRPVLRAVVESIPESR
jgi:hypothetical protein